MERITLQSLGVFFLVLFVSTARGESGRLDYDLDNDGLIEINDLADLSEIRNNLDGSSLYGSNAGCPESGCVGFELTSDLDFDTNGDGVIDEQDDYWNSGEGWVPIGNGRRHFEGIFNGNGYVIQNLYIDRPKLDNQGLFGVTDSAVIQAVGLTGPSMQVTGDAYTGGLVGSARNTELKGVFSTGKIRSYEAIAVLAGGLVGELANSRLSFAFAAGEVRVDREYAGGLASIAKNSDIAKSYSTTWVSGAQWGGGLVGYGSSDQTTSSYWAEDVSALPVSEGGEGVSLQELQCPTQANESACADIELYQEWDSAGKDEDIYWDFGTDKQLPALVLYGRKYRDSDGDGVLDQDDAFPDTYAAAKDTDGDGAIDAWSPACDASCREASGLVLDQFPNNAAASVDLDLDGRPDEWNVDCDEQCRAQSGLTLDEYPNDMDNDGVLDSQDDDVNDDGVLDADSDSNGLIDIDTLEQLDAVRHNFSGTARRMTEKGELDASGCPAVIHRGVLQRRCKGYELKSDLDFDTNGDGVIDEQDEYWNDGEGWEPIDSSDHEFRVVFDGNGHLLRNLYINRPEEINVGLLGSIRNVEIKGLAVVGPLTRITGKRSVGSLIGFAEDTYLKGVFGAGHVIGLEQIADANAGGLVGLAWTTQITATFFSGEVSAQSDHVGGIAGHMETGELKHSFSSGNVYSEGKYGDMATSVSGTDVQGSYWVRGINDARSGGVGVGYELERLQCATADNNYRCTSNPLYEAWPKVEDSSGEPYWDFGTENQLPGLVLFGKIYRDSDGDGLLDDEDARPYDHDNDGVDDAEDDLPVDSAASLDTDGDGRPDSWNENCDSQCQSDSNLELDPDRDGDGVDDDSDPFPLSAAASVDADKDGLPDAWNDYCYSECQDESGLTLDPYPDDTDNDGVINEEDAFPLLAEASEDTDGDGRPDRWKEDCDAQCQSDSELELDPDIDGDGVDNDTDAFPLTAAASVDTDDDGLPDEWHGDCDKSCQEASGSTLDQYLDDTDNDGVINSEDHYPLDADRWKDDVPPEMVLVPEPMDIDSTGEYTEVALKVENAEGYDSFDDSVSYRVYYEGEQLEWDDQHQVELRVGKVVLNWVAVDRAGNESEPMSQTVNVYPQVRFTESESATGEGDSARVQVHLSGPSPVYPVELRARWVEADSTASVEDIQTEGANAVNLESISEVIESEDARSSAAFRLPVIQDNEPEVNEQLILALDAAYAGEDESENGEGTRYSMPLDEAGIQHILTITEDNLPPSLSLQVEQAGEVVEVIRPENGEVTVQAMITDANTDDEHQLEWYTDSLPFVVNNADQHFTFDPMDLDAGSYSISAIAMDNGDPPLYSEEATLTLELEAPDADEAPEEDYSDEETSDDEPAGDESNDDAQQDLENDTGGSSDTSGNATGGSGGSISILALLLLILTLARVESRLHFLGRLGSFQR